MPTVPRYQQQIRPSPVQPALEDTRRDPRAFGAGEAAAMARTGQVVSQVAAQEAAEARRRRLQTLAMEADLAAAEQVSRLLRDPKDGLYRRQGLEAQDALQGLPDQLDGIRADIAGGLEGEARGIFEQAFARRQQSVAHDYRQYAMRQQEQWDKDVRGAQVERAIQDVAADPFSDTAREALDHGRMALEANLRGQSDDMIRQARSAYYTQAHGGAVNTLLGGGDLAGAKQYMDQHGDDIEPGARAKITERIRSMTDLVEAQAFAEGRLDHYQPSGSAEVALMLDAALQDARAAYEGPQQEQALQQVRARFAQEADAIRAREGQEVMDYARRMSGEDYVTQPAILADAPLHVQEALGPAVAQRAAAATQPNGQVPEDQIQQTKVSILGMIDHGAIHNRDQLAFMTQGLPAAEQQRLMARFEQPEVHVQLRDVQESMDRRGAWRGRPQGAQQRAAQADELMRQVEAHLKPGVPPTPHEVDRIIGVLLSEGTIAVPGERPWTGTHLEARQAGQGRWFSPQATPETLERAKSIVHDMQQRLQPLMRGEGDWLAPGNADLRAFAHGLGIRDEALASGDPQALLQLATELHVVQHHTPERFARQAQGMTPLGVSPEEHQQIAGDLARSRYEQVLEMRAAQARDELADARLADIVSDLRFFGTDALGAGAVAARSYVEDGAPYNVAPQWLQDAMGVYGVDFEEAYRVGDSLSAAERTGYWLNIADTILSRLPGAE